MSRYECTYYQPGGSFVERHPDIPSALDRLSDSMVTVKDTIDGGHTHISFLLEEDVYDVMHVTHVEPPEDALKTLHEADAALRDLEWTAFRMLGDYQTGTWRPHTCDAQSAARVELWDIYERDWRKTVVAASCYLNERDDIAVRRLHDMARAVQHAKGKRTRVRGPLQDTRNQVAIHRVAAVKNPDELAVAVLPTFLADQ